MRNLPGVKPACHGARMGGLVLLIALGHAASLPAQVVLPGPQLPRLPGPGAVWPTQVEAPHAETPPAAREDPPLTLPIQPKPTAEKAESPPRLLSDEVRQSGTPLPATKPAAAAPTDTSVQPALALAPGEPDALTPGNILQVGCRFCGSGSTGVLDPLGAAPPPWAGPDGTCECAGGHCVPGRKPCGCGDCDAQTRLGRFLCGVYECICCPDPCYDPHWEVIADSAFFVDAPRPQTSNRLRWEEDLNMVFPDRAEYFWARADGMGKGPRPPAGVLGERLLSYGELSLYTEVAAGNFAIINSLPYRSIDPQTFDHASGFSDIMIGTKTLLFDCELLQLSFEMKTFLPTGNFTKGLGTGHVSLEPSLLLGIRLAPDAYFQSQVCEWIPLGGDPNYQGAILHYHFSFNDILCRPLHNVEVVGTLECSGWTFQNGSFTSPDAGPFQQASGETYFSAGPGLRMDVCNRIDFGVGTQRSLTYHNWGDWLFRSEFRWRY